MDIIEKEPLDYLSIEEFITAMSKKEEIIGIMEYGNRSYTNIEKGGDYDCVLVTNEPLSLNINGAHFHIAGIPVDCMFKDLNAFVADTPGMFDVSVVNGKILYDETGELSKRVEVARLKWADQPDLTEGEISFLRFIARHCLDKVDHRLFADHLYSHYTMSISVDFYLTTYAKLHQLEIGKPRAMFAHMRENDPELIEMTNNFFQPQI